MINRCRPSPQLLVFQETLQWSTTLVLFDQKPSGNQWLETADAHSEKGSIITKSSNNMKEQWELFNGGKIFNPEQKNESRIQVTGRLWLSTQLSPPELAGSEQLNNVSDLPLRPALTTQYSVAIFCFVLTGEIT